MRDSPTLWRYIDSNPPHGAYLNSLAKSKHVPLVVQYTDSHRRYRNNVSDDLRLFMEAAFGQVHPWQSVVINLNSELSGALFNRLVQSPAPLLEELEITGTMSDLVGFGHMDRLLDGAAPRLRHLTLADILISWDSGILSPLLTLDVTEEHTPIGPAAFQLARIMRDCPLIVELNIECSIMAIEEVDVVPIGVQSIELPSLKVLSLHITPVALGSILQVIRIPNCTQFHIFSEIPASNNFLGATGHLVPVLSAILLSAEFIEICLSATQLDYNVYQDDRNLFRVMLDSKWERQDASPLSTLAWILDRIHPLPSSIPIELSINGNNLPLTELLASLRPYPIIALNIRHSGRSN
ncbi:hypothetical protein FRB95_009327 [Tulasnella sp. JGI-2019a]|nr:hypothetical protein FRB95_009327 [Tulasnella sp. JGI-2019a]